MYGKNYQLPQDESVNEGTEIKQSQINNWKLRFALKDQRKQLQKRLFGDHYNYSKVGLNKEKKYMIEQQRNTEIERSNRILLEKIQKIAKRSVPNGLRKRAFTQEQEEEVQIQEKSVFKHSKFFTDDRNADNKSLHQLTRNNMSQYRTPREKKILFVGQKQAEGKVYDLKIYIEKGKLVIQLQLGKMNQKIKIDLDNYKSFYRDYLEKDHARIVDYLKFNGTIFELGSIKKQSVTVEEETHFNLPHIDSKTETKQRLIDRIDF